MAGDLQLSGGGAGILSSGISPSRPSSLAHGHSAGLTVPQQLDHHPIRLLGAVR